MLNSCILFLVERLDQHPPAPARQAGTHERSRIVDAQQSSLDTDPSRKQQLAQFDNAWFALVCGYEVWHLVPRLDNPETLSRIPHDRG
jgi:hypothetical protein